MHLYFNRNNYEVYFIMELVAVIKTSLLPFSLLSSSGWCSVRSVTLGNAALRADRDSLQLGAAVSRCLPGRDADVPSAPVQGKQLPALPPAAAAKPCPMLSADSSSLPY